MSARQSKYSPRRPEGGSPYNSSKVKAAMNYTVATRVNTNPTGEMCVRQTLNEEYDFGIFVDDERMPSDVHWVTLPKVKEWRIVRSYREFRMLIKELVAAGTYQSDTIAVSFDYVLSVSDMRAPTGRDCLEAFLVERQRLCKLSDIFFHSSDKDFRQSMADRAAEATFSEFDQPAKS